jgi:hypothetical protein
MSWDGALGSLFEDLEQQAAGLSLDERDAEVAELHLAEYAQIGLAARLHASVGRDLDLRLLGGRAVTGRLERAGEDWLVVDATPSAHLPTQWVVRTAAIASAAGLSDRARGPQTWGVTDRLSLRSLLRRLSQDRVECLVHAVDASVLEGTVGRVGHDFLELLMGRDDVHVVPVDSVAALQGRP